VYDEVKYRVDNKVSAVANEKYRMMFAELPPWHSLSFFDKLAENWGIAMVYESWGYHAPLPIPDEALEGVTDPLERIALLTYFKYTEVKAAAKKYDIHTPRTGGNLRAAPEYKADGIICHPLRSCRPATYELLSTKNILEEKLKIPGVMIDGDIVDFRVFNEEEALSKMEAFVETMDNYREQRKKAEMPW
jgi:hypothetical protein